MCDCRMRVKWDVVILNFEQILHTCVLIHARAYARILSFILFNMCLVTGELLAGIHTFLTSTNLPFSSDRKNVPQIVAEMVSMIYVVCSAISALYSALVILYHYSCSSFEQVWSFPMQRKVNLEQNIIDRFEVKQVFLRSVLQRIFRNFLGKLSKFAL